MPAVADPSMLDVSLPVFAIILMGYLCGRFRLLGEGAATAVNGFTYYAAMPALFLGAITSAGFSVTDHLGYIAVLVGAQLAVFGISMLSATVLFPGSLGAHSLHSLSATLTNSGYIGIPMMALAYGEPGVLLAIIATLVNGLVFLTIGSILLELDRAEHRSIAGMALVTLTGVLKSPLVLGALAGLILAAFDIELPGPARSVVDMLGGTAGPCALFAIGLFLVGQKITTGAAEVAWVSFVKLLLLPLVTWVIVLFIIPLPPLETAAAVLMAAMPTGSLVFVLSERHGVFAARSVAIVLVTTVLSCITVSGLLTIFL